MDKLKFIGWTIFGLICYYLFLTIIISIVQTWADNAVTDVNASANAASYALSVAALRFMPWALYLFPGVAAIILIMLKLKDKLPGKLQF